VNYFGRLDGRRGNGLRLRRRSNVITVDYKATVRRVEQLSEGFSRGGAHA